eukprot:819093_1
MQIHHNSNPSAPPPEDDDYEWIVNSMNNQNENENQNNNVSNQQQGFIQPNDMPIPDAIQQQIIYQRIMAEKVEKEKQNQQQQNNEYKQEPLPIQEGHNNNNNNNKPKPSFMNKDILYPESSLYKTAGIAIWRPKENGKGIQFMMGIEKNSNSLSSFGGKKEENDKKPVDTAIREFHEETGNTLDNDTLAQIRRMLLTDKDRCLFWKSEWKSVLYYYQMSYDYNIAKDYSVNKKK